MTTYNHKFLTDALTTLAPDAKWAIRNGELEWNDLNSLRPSDEEIEEAVEKVSKKWENTQYQRQRAPEYPSITDQLDALFHAGVFPPEMAEQIQAIKDKYPKPE
jgi:hypothetical protein